jgi:hypothetical protein
LAPVFVDRPRRFWRWRACAACGVAFAAWSLFACELGNPADPELGLVTSSNRASDPPCESTLPSTCPSPTPSWSGQVAAIVARVCGQCHADGGVEQYAFDFSTYQGVFANRSSILSQVYTCAMPPSDGGVTLSSGDRDVLLAWLVCNAPHN